MPMLRWAKAPRNVGLYHENPDAEPHDEDDQDQDSESGLHTNTEAESQGSGNDEEFFPSVSDVLCVREFFIHMEFGKRPELDNASPSEGEDTLGHEQPHLPVEVIDMILDEAEYWPSIMAEMKESKVISQDQDAEILKTGGLCYAPTTSEIKPRVLPHRTIRPCRKILFNVVSHDQGWGGERGESPYHGSYTWFDVYRIPAFKPPQSESGDQPSPAELMEQYQAYHNEITEPRFDVRTYFLPTGERLCSNQTANGESQEREITWHYHDSIDPESDEAERIDRWEGRGRCTLDGKLVRGMEIGDELSIIARARFGGWCNQVQSLKVRVFWAV